MSSREQIINNLCREISYMDDWNKNRLKDIWRYKRKFFTAIPSLYELAVELGIERRLIDA